MTILRGVSTVAELTVSRMVTRFLLCRGHRPPAPWTAVSAEGLLQALAAALDSDLGTTVGPLAVEQYERALEALAEQDILQLSHLDAAGFLLEEFCSFLVERGLLSGNPHVGLATSESHHAAPIQAGNTAPAGRPAEGTPALDSITTVVTPVPAVESPAAHSSSAPAHPAATLTGWDWWLAYEEQFFKERETGRGRLEGSSPYNYRSDLKLAQEYFRGTRIP